ncbi:MAG: fibronectin type III domain-containing protein [Chloroflexi bacterium]|nr:fibronectin type III domain-containing protein [Chloroflexota bacterium]
MIMIVFIIGCILSFLFLRKKREFEKYNRKKDFLYYFYQNSLDFLVPFVLITFLYLMLSLVVASIVASDSITLHSLIRFEESLEKLKSFFSIFKLNAIEALVVLVALYLLGFFRFMAQKSRKLFKLFDKYQLVVRRVYIVLVLLCSFTFFGTQLGEPTKNVSLRIKTIRDGYADLCNQAREAISEEVAIQIYPKVFGSFPKPYQDALELPTKIEQETNSLRDYYNSVRNEFGVTDRNVEVLFDRGSLRARSASDLKVEVPDGTTKRIDYFAFPNLQQINYKKIKDAKNAVSQYRSNLKSRAIEMLKIEGGKKVTCQIPKVFTGEVKKALLQQIIKDYPILEPVVDVFFKTLDKQVETKVEQAIEDVVNSAIQSPESFDKSVVEQASTIVEHKKVEITKADFKTAQRASIELRNKLARIRNARTNLFHSVAPKDLSIELNSNLSVDISWSSVPDAQSYKIYRSSDRSGSFNKANSETTEGTGIKEWPEEFPTYYRVTAVKGALESKPAKLVKAELLSSQGGTRCQICGSESIGYCHMRDIYVCSSHNIFTSKDGTDWRCP